MEGDDRAVAFWLRVEERVKSKIKPKDLAWKSPGYIPTHSSSTRELHSSRTAFHPDIQQRMVSSHLTVAEAWKKDFPIEFQLNQHNARIYNLCYCRYLLELCLVVSCIVV